MIIKEANGFKFICRDYPKYDDEFCVNEVVGGDVYKIKDWKFKNGIIVDIGANIGSFAIPASKYGKVFAYEPSQENFEILKMNIALNNANVEAFNCAVGKPGWDTIESSNSGHSRIGAAGGEGNQEVKVIGFDDIPFAVCDFLKMDCEGGEYNIIKYASDAKLDKVKQFAAEFHSWIFEDGKLQAELNVKHSELVAKLKRFFTMSSEGYKCSAIYGVKK